MHGDETKTVVESVLEWFAVAVGIAAIVCGVITVVLMSFEDQAAGLFIVIAVVLGIGDYALIAVLGFMEVYNRSRERNHTSKQPSPPAE